MLFKSSKTNLGISRAQAERPDTLEKTRNASSSTNGNERSSGLEAFVQIMDLRKVYRSGSLEIEVLKGVDLQVQSGDMVAIMGPSGCGKTTLLNCASGLDTIDGGEVRIAGHSLSSLTDRQRTAYRSRHMGFIFQSFNLLPVLNAVENVELPLLIAGVRAGEARRRALDALDMIGLSDRTTHHPSELSGGQQQRVTIARALVVNPSIIWADEPTGNLDSENAALIMKLIKKLNSEHNQTFVIVTHSQEVSGQAKRVIRMRDGCIESDTSQELVDGQPQVGALSNGPV